MQQWSCEGEKAVNPMVDGKPSGKLCNGETIHSTGPGCQLSQEYLQEAQGIISLLKESGV